MNKKTSLTFIAALMALSFTSATQADESLVERAAIAVGNAVGQAIAGQGNAALIEIQRELKAALPDQLKPYLPAPQRTTKLARKEG